MATAWLRVYAGGTEPVGGLALRCLVHTCCGPCSVTVNEALVVQGWTLTNLFYNPNIHPYSEYRARLDSLEQLTAADPSRTLLVSEDYALEEFIRRVAQKPAERCRVCYRMRLDYTAHRARTDGFDSFTTTLLVSPYQDHEGIRSAGEAASLAHGVRFLYADFRPSFRVGQALAAELGLYRQKYCGCVYSEMERYLKRKAR